jgi:2-methylcitrate dehydratase PrpD
MPVATADNLMCLTRDFADHLRSLAASPLDATARRAAVDVVVDGLAVAALGSMQTGPRLLAGLALDGASRPEATLIGQGARVCAAEAARINGAAMHVLDYEPMWNPANHALSPVLPALLALAERKVSDSPHPRPLGLRLLVALAVGIEGQARLRLASGQLEPGSLIFHPPGAVGPIGSAVGCAVLLGLDPVQLVHAIGIAASRAGGILANAGSMTKALHCGQAAQSGLEAALLAQRGFTADTDALAGPRGFGTAFFRDRFDPGELTAHRADWHIVEPGPAFKLYPSQYGTHFAIAAARDAHSRLPAQASIESVRIVCPPMPYVDRPHPASGLAGKFSFQYAAAVALLDGKVTVDSFADRRRFAPDLEALLPRIALEPDPAREGRFDRMRLDLTVRCTDGTIVEARCDGPAGIWGRPCAPQQLRAKASDCLTAAFGSERAQQILGAAYALDEFDHRDLTALMDQFSGPCRDAPIGECEVR